MLPKNASMEIYMCVYTHTPIHTCIYMYIYTYMHTHIYIHTICSGNHICNGFLLKMIYYNLVNTNMTIELSFGYLESCYTYDLIVCVFSKVHTIWWYLQWFFQRMLSVPLKMCNVLTSFFYCWTFILILILLDCFGACDLIPFLRSFLKLIELRLLLTSLDQVGKMFYVTCLTFFLVLQICKFHKY